MTVERRFPYAPQSVTAARRFAMDELRGVAPDVAEAVGVMVSELTTNAVRHAASGFTVAIDRDADGVRVEVRDTGRGRPVMRSPEANDHTGRGLRIVDAFADEWGITDATRRDGKGVWFALRFVESCAGATER
jgi:two-component sensor histidine kinase